MGIGVCLYGFALDHAQEEAVLVQHTVCFYMIKLSDGVIQTYELCFIDTLHYS